MPDFHSIIVENKTEALPVKSYHIRAPAPGDYAPTIGPKVHPKIQAPPPYSTGTTPLEPPPLEMRP